jgi:putative glutamine amidotransferase
MTQNSLHAVLHGCAGGPTASGGNTHSYTPGGRLQPPPAEDVLFLIAHLRPPLIGIVTHDLLADAKPAWAPAPGRRERDLSPPRLNLRLTYVQAISEAKGIAVVLPAHGFADDAHALLDRLDGVLFSGGPDLDPATYDQLPHPRLGPDVDRTADEYELRMLRAARERDIPILAICRGMQALNVAAGGTLHQHIPDFTDLDHRPVAPPHEAAHTATVAAGSPLHTLTGHRRLHVNSVHHQAIDTVGDGLEVIARAPDGIIEAVHDPSLRFCLGVQWHAEVLTHRAEHAPVIDALISAAGRPALRIAA